MNDPPPPTPPTIDVEIIEGAVSMAELHWPGNCGAECVFVGRTRSETHPKFGELFELQYEVYEPMAQKLLQQMAQDAATKFDCQAVRFSHAHGTVKPGEASVVIQVATPHRSESFEACRYLIDRLKHELPIWKRELWQRGETFVEGCCAHHESDRKVTRDDT